MFELVIAYILLNYLYRHKYSVNPINKSALLIQESSNFKYFYEPLPRITIQPKVNHVGWEVVYTINDDSLNETKNYQIKKDKFTFRIITLGDSFTFGENVSTKNNWSELLEEELNSHCGSQTFEVINLGFSGYDTAYEYERYRKRGKKYNPDLIIWYSTEFERFTEGIELIRKGQKLDETNIDTWSYAINKLKSKYTNDDLFALQIHYFKRFAKELQGSSSLLIISNQYNEIRNNLGTNNIFYSNIFIANDDDDLRIPNDGHFSLKGNIFMADKIYDYLVRNKIILCR